MSTNPVPGLHFHLLPLLEQQLRLQLLLLLLLLPVLEIEVKRKVVPHVPGVEGAGVQRQGLTLVHFSAQRKHILWDTLAA
jgi:hypothetical protein